MMGFLKGRGKKILAVDFSQAMMEIVYVRAWPDRFKLLAYESKKIPSDEEKRAEAIIGAMNEFLSRNSIAGKDVILSLSDMDSVVIKHLVLPNLPEAEILGAARWQMKEDVPFDLEGASIDWQVVSSSVDEEGVKKNAAVFIAAQKEKIAWHLSMMQRCRLNPVKIVSGPFNYAHLLKHIPGKTKAPAILDIDYKCSSLNIYKDNTLHFTRRLPISWEKLTRSLTESLSSEKGNIELTLEEAEEIRNTHGIPLDDNQTITDNIQATHIISLIRPLLEALVRELKFSFHYMASNSDLEKPSLLFISGGDVN
ncbi:MAG: pilus assembly protein PilM, partial [Candidatus Omnitrophota bacterium]